MTDYPTLIVWHLTFSAMEWVDADTPFLPTALDLQNRMPLAAMAACRRPVRTTDGHENSLEDLPVRGIDVHQQQVFPTQQTFGTVARRRLAANGTVKRSNPAPAALF